MRVSGLFDEETAACLGRMMKREQLRWRAVQRQARREDDEVLASSPPPELEDALARDLAAPSEVGHLQDVVHLSEGQRTIMRASAFDSKTLLIEEPRSLRHRSG